jgi:hypothetical protein
LPLEVTIGFIGGLTTYSSFNYETMRLFEEGALVTAAVNVAFTLVGGFAAGWLGLVTAREILMTAHGTPEVTKGALDLGAYEVMHKPFELHDLEPLLLKAFASSASRHSTPR